jgi:hypothetical protein
MATEFVLDASVAFSWCFPGNPSEDTPYSRHILALLTDRDAVVPEVWALEIANSIFVAFSKRKRITELQIREYLALLKDLPIRVDPEEMRANLELETRARQWI